MPLSTRSLIRRYPSLQASDSIQVAHCLEERVDAGVSPDQSFDQIAELRLVDPTDTTALATGA